MMGLHQVILTSASLQKQLNTPFYKELLADRAASVADLTPAEWNNLRNTQCLPPAPTERAVPPASPSLTRALRSHAPTDAVEEPFIADMKSYSSEDA